MLPTAESKKSESLVVATTSKAVEKEQVSQKPLTSAAMNSEIVCRECIFSLLHERKLSKDALREAIVRGFESATKLNRKKQLREQILETPLRDTFERALKEVANFRAPGRYELKRERVEEGRRANASASLWISCRLGWSAPGVKRRMIEWWGPIIYEYYAGSEGNGFVAINSEEWLAHKGSVGRGLTAVLHICDESGEEVGVGESGVILWPNGCGGFHSLDRITRYRRESKF
mgnify:CR=1 FL=1